VIPRQQLLELVAGRLPSGPGRLRVGIDGRDGAGKTRFADELADAVGRLGRPVVRVSADDFHQVRSIRYRRGRDSPIGFWLDSYDYPRLIADVLEPFGAGCYRPAAHDLLTDQVLDPPWLVAPAGAVLILDGLFLHRDELVGHWDFTVYLAVSGAVAAERMAGRDGSRPDPDHPSLRRYSEAQQLYLDSCAPQRRASIVIDNNDLAAPVISLSAPIQSDRMR
jgi:uridine kinase